ncbi:thioredoxin [Haladaptatus paucihalophilus DX253]|uniref:Thioredoxin n=1 Tax=Haladaptatus paucihalophilus DX253 TaxID=797209 RepID=E7QR57_HALPU|nr:MULTISPECIES: thioredoxin [Haladaptatus]EFW92965.1 thioredoxin [Haladaptatus paucihalophilus DX253]GKZ15802.1 thiol reductase thioredoxin [Haladaptatus sp. T7]SHL18028.1 thioredoxin [Haladaptatus paucihalophilus DX253]
MTDEISEIRKQKREELMNGTTEEDEGTPKEPVHVESESHLNELTKTNDVVLVDFYADWCGPCKMLEPVVKAVAKETEAVVAKVDIDQHQLLAQQNGVRGVPTLQLYADGEVAKRMVGMQDQATLMNLVNQFA